MKTIEILKENMLKKSNRSSYSLERSRIKAEFLAVCSKYLKKTEEVLVFTLSSQRDLSAFIDIVNDDDIQASYIITQEENNLFSVELKELDIVV